MVQVTIFDDTDALYRAAGEHVAARARDSIGGSGRFTLALAGGDTPRRLYALLASPSFRGRIDWTRTHLFWGDERLVPTSDPRSNYRMVSETLLSRAYVPEENVHRARADLPPQEAAADYERVLDEFFGGMPAFDCVLLGMGADGHTASLFPGSAALRVSDRIVVAAEHRGQARVSLSLQALNAARDLLFIVIGMPKASALAAVLEGPLDRDLPAGLVHPAAGNVTWLVDRAAASHLKRHG